MSAPRRFLNARNTFAELLAYDVVPIVNENDTVAVQELRFGDNDTLSAQVREGGGEGEGEGWCVSEAHCVHVVGGGATAAATAGAGGGPT